MSCPQAACAWSIVSSTCTLSNLNRFNPSRTFYQTFVVGILNYLRKLRETNLNSEKLLVVTVLVGVLFSTEAASERRKHSRERGGGAGLGL